MTDPAKSMAVSSLLCAALCVLPPAAAYAATDAHINVYGTRPLAMALDDFEEETGVAVSYEDPVYVSESDLEAMVLEPDRLPALPESDRSELLSLSVPRRGAISLDFPLPAGEVGDYSDILRRLITQHRVRGNAGRFRLSLAVEGFYVVSPWENLGSQGGWRREGSVLDSSIRLATREGTLLSLVEEIISSAEQKTGILIKMGLLPWNLLARHSARLPKAEGTVRELLAKCVLTLRNEGFEPKWRLLYDTNRHYYVFNLIVSPAKKTGTRDLEPLSPGLLPSLDNSLCRSAWTPPRCASISMKLCASPPNGEGSLPGGWVKGEDKAAFRGWLEPKASTFYHVTVTECPLPSKEEITDECFDRMESMASPGGAYASTVVRFNLSNGIWGIDAHNEYEEDRIGFGVDLNTHYPIPCKMRVDQRMRASCDLVWCEYATNVVLIRVERRCVIIIRDGTSIEEPPKCP